MELSKDFRTFKTPTAARERGLFSLLAAGHGAPDANGAAIGHKS
jgi:hypothetical protein